MMDGAVGSASEADEGPATPSGDVIDEATNGVTNGDEA